MKRLLCTLLSCLLLGSIALAEAPETPNVDPAPLTLEEAVDLAAAYLMQEQALPAEAVEAVSPKASYLAPGAELYVPVDDLCWVVCFTGTKDYNRVKVVMNAATGEVLRYGYMAKYVYYSSILPDMPKVTEQEALEIAARHIQMTPYNSAAEMLEQANVEIYREAKPYYYTAEPAEVGVLYHVRVRWPKSNPIMMDDFEILVEDGTILQHFAAVQ